MSRVSNSQLPSAQVTRHGVTQTTQYRYDALGRRISKADAFGSTHYLWDGDLMVQSQRASQQAALSIYEPNSFVPLATVQQCKTYWYQCDQIGAPLELTDAQGQIVWSADYKVWGQAKVWQGLRTGTDGWADRMELRSEGRMQMFALEQPFRFQGQQFDAETGLHYNRYRYYDPVVGRFVSQDPIGLLGGINNLIYVPDPLAWIDPFGPSSTKPNIDRRKKCVCKWSVENSDRVCEGHVRGVGVARYFRNPTTSEWWSEELTGHGGSAWKVFDMNGGTLEWKADANEYGDFIKNKHKSDAGVKIPTKDMKCKNL